MRVSSLLKIRSESLALAFDIAATARLKIEDDEKEKRMIEALTAGSTLNTMQGIAAGLSKTPGGSKPNASLPRQ